MATKFEMSDLGKLTYYLGIEVLQHENGIMLKQERYATKILEEAGMKDCNAAQAPMDPGLQLSKAKEEKGVDETNNRRNIGCLRYLLQTRPDLSYSVGILSRYLKRTLAHGPSFRRETKPGLIGYSDSSLGVDLDDGRSTSGHIFYLNECPITWTSQKQETVSLSSCESEFMAATETAKQAICKHIHQRYHFIRECIENELIEVEHVPGTEQRADILTKALGRIKFKEMRELIGIQDLSKEDFKLKEENVGISLIKA
ncbi:uncharacterized protein LOC112082029 [Eutrema salsugineum]|uniref:uncharacterized protein LOC112082029 n=1 Tax=Eutrema salsugineum TaxID=72664 RepID=UPI000CED2811|nr:uncharacterized protein LOC112082029 [Eutrema salsugineum]